MKIQLRDLIVGAAVAIIGIFLYINVESYEEEYYTEAGAEVYNQSFLALQKHLANFNTAVVMADDYKQLFSNSSFNPIMPNTDDVVVLTESEVSISAALSSKILNWVDSGGHIIIGVTADNYASIFSTNQLLKELGIETEEFDRELLEQDEGIDSTYNVPTLIDTEEFGEIKVNVEDSLYIELNKPEQVLYSNGVLSDQQPTIVQLAIGNGVVTIMSDVYIWNNRQILDHDNIIFIHQLIKSGNKLFIFEPKESLMWYQIIPKYSPSFYWILLFVVILFSWFVGVRFGSINIVSNNIVSYFSQHIRAAGQFYWTSGQQEKLLASTRKKLMDDVSGRISRTNPTKEQIVEALIGLSNWPKEKIYYFVFDNNKVNEAQFTQIMQGLQQLRKMI